MRSLFSWWGRKGGEGFALATLPSLSDIESLKGKRVLLRASLNVPLKNDEVAETFRLEQALPTINFLQEHGARTIIIGHIGRDPEETLKPVADELAHMAGVKWGGDIVGANESLATLQDGEAILLENLRRDPREGAGDNSLAEGLASLADIYINDAFSDSHRDHASIVGVPKYLPTYFGFSFLHEYNALSAVLNPVSPSVFIIGGAKFETKLPLVQKFANRYDHVFIAGALANDIYKARGLEVGRSLVSDIDLSGDELLSASNLILPTDVVVEAQDGSRRVVADTAVQSDDIIFDAGPATITNLTPLIKKAKTVLWNGPLGNYEKGYAESTEELAGIIADSKANSVVGGGDTIASIRQLGLSERFGFLSSAGGAMLVFLETGTLPAIDAVKK